MKKTIAIISMVALCSFGYAQSPIGKGGKQLNFGVGLYDHGIPVYIGMDFGVHPDITVGPQIGFDLKLDYISFTGRGDYHFNSVLNIPRDWDFYAGLNIGFVADLDSGSSLNGLDLGLQIGGRYYWNSGWGVNLEFGGGYNLSGGRFGLSKRF